MCASEITFGYLLCPVIRRSAEARFWGFYHGFGDVFRRFGLFLAWAPSGDSPKAGSTKWEKSVEELGENVQAKSRRCFRFRIFAVRPFVAAHTTEPVPACRAFRGILSASSSFFITETYSSINRSKKAEVLRFELHDVNQGAVHTFMAPTQGTVKLSGERGR